VHGAIEEFAQELAYVTQRFLKTKPGPIPNASWSAAAFARAGVGELAIARTDILLKPKASKSIWCRSAFTPMKPA